MNAIAVADGLFPERESLNRLAISASGFVFDPVSGTSFSVNGTGLAVLKALQAGEDEVPALVARLAAEYAAEPALLERDLLEFAGQLRAAVK